MAQGGRISSSNDGVGNAGQVELHVRQLLILDQGGVSISTLQRTDEVVTTGSGGQLTVRASERVVIDGSPLPDELYQSVLAATGWLSSTAGAASSPTS